MSNLTYDTAKTVVKDFAGEKNERNQDMIMGFILGVMGRVKFDEADSEPEKKSA